MTPVMFAQVHASCKHHELVRVCSDSNPPKSDKLTAITEG